MDQRVLEALASMLGPELSAPLLLASLLPMASASSPREAPGSVKQEGEAPGGKPAARLGSMHGPAGDLVEAAGGW